MKMHYFEQTEADPDDIKLKMAINQSYVPETCLLGGMVIMDEIGKQRNPCHGCRCDRIKCKGSPFKE